MIRIFHPDHGYLLVTDDNEKKRLLETGGYISESFDNDISKEDNVVNEELTTFMQADDVVEIINPSARRGRKPKKWQ